MAARLVIDFGTTNTIVARWNESTNQPETLRLARISAPPLGDMPSTIPSLLYVVNAAKGEVLAGYEVRSRGLDNKTDARFFSGFKRTIAADFAGHVPELDGKLVDAKLAGAWFLWRVLQAAKEAGELTDEVIFTAPVQAFERYTQWLTHVSGRLGVKEMHIVDESTAAALGYDIDRPRSSVLVFDFGGGTLDLSVVRTPENGGASRPGVLVKLGRLFGRGAKDNQEDPWQGIASVLGKAAEILGGEDIDHWIVDDLLATHGVSAREVAGIAQQLKFSAEAAKVELSRENHTELSVFDVEGMRTLAKTLARSHLEDKLLEPQGFFEKVQHCLDSVVRQAEQRGVRKEDLQRVLLTGGTSQMPCVARVVRQNFGTQRVEVHKPFEAVAHGGLRLVHGAQVEDFLYHSYGVRGWNSDRGRHEYDLLVQAGIKYPTRQPIERRYPCAHKNQEAIELPVGEIDHGSVGTGDIILKQGRLEATDGQVAVASERYALVSADHAAPLSARPLVIRLSPPGMPGQDRIEVRFYIDGGRNLLATVTDLQTRKTVMQDQKLVELK